jgi:AAA+ ATPase superfamily predicted ATPase
MRITTFRRTPFIDREKEEAFILDHLQGEPAKILFIYGPKSSGKTTLMEYIVENILEKDKNFYVNYVNFRRYAIGNYKDFLDIYFQPIKQENKSWLAKIVESLPLRLGLFKGTASLPVKGINFGINIELYNKLQNNEIDPFVLLMDILRNIKAKRQPILILDEIQTLKDIYMNGDIRKKYLLTEFFNFLVSLTKETHLAHVIVMTSETLFLEEIYNHSKLSKTSDFYLINHLDQKTVQTWFEHEGVYEEKIFGLIWEYCGGAVFDLLRPMNLLKNNNTRQLREYLTDQVETYMGKIDHFIAEKLTAVDEKRMFKDILKILIKQNYIIRDAENELQKKVLNKAVEYEFLFLNPKRKEIIFNSQIIKKGAELYFEIP